VTSLDQLRLRLPDHDFDWLMQAAKPIASPERAKTLQWRSASTKWLGRAYCIGSSAKCTSAMTSLISAALIQLNPQVDAMPLSPEQEVLCERVEKGEPTPRAAALIRQQAKEIDDLWDRLSHAYALVRRESPAEMLNEEMEALRAMLEERASKEVPSGVQQASDYPRGMPTSRR
jgi:hypothetical protein